MCEITHHRRKPNYFLNALLKCKHFLAATYCLAIYNQNVFS